MKQSYGKLIATIAPLVILTSAAAVGWNDYFTEVDKNESLVLASQQQQARFEQNLADRQTDIEALQAAESALKVELASAIQSRVALAETMEQIKAEKIANESNLREKLDAASIEVTERAAEVEVGQARINQLEVSEMALKTKLLVESQSLDELTASLEAERQVREQVTALLETEKRSGAELAALLESERQSRDELLSELATEQQSREELTAMLASTLADKLAMEDNLRQQVQRVVLTTAELESELERRRATQKSLYQKLSSINGEKSQLLKKLEQEQASKREIANLKNRLEQELNESRIEVLQLRNQMTVIQLTSEVLFGSGSARLKPEGQKVLSIIAESLNQYPNRAVSIEGHTDDLPIQTTRFESNWELSTARSLAAVEFLQSHDQVNPRRLRVVGYGQYRPVSSNETAQGRKLNRRIEIKILPPESIDIARN